MFSRGEAVSDELLERCSAVGNGFASIDIVSDDSLVMPKPARTSNEHAMATSTEGWVRGRTRLVALAWLL